MTKTVKTQKETTLEAATTAHAKREARRHGVELSTYVAHLAAKSDRMPVTVQLKMVDIARINSLIGGGRVHEWLENIIPEVLDSKGPDREICVPVEFPEDLHEWVHDRAATLKTSPEELVREAVMLAKKRADKAAKN